MAKGSVFIANTSFAMDIDTGKKDENGNPITQQHIALMGRKYAASHPLVKLSPQYFDSDEEGAKIDYGNAPLEAASAAPGELRNR